MNNSSVSDIVFDIILFLEYIYGKPVDSVVSDVYSPWFGSGNVTCTLYNSTSDVCEKYFEKNYWFGILTLSFIYLPSVNVVTSLYGPETTGTVGIVMSLGMAVVGGVFAASDFAGGVCSGLAYQSLASWIVGVDGEVV